MIRKDRCGLQWPAPFYFPDCAVDPEKDPAQPKE